MIEQLLVNLRLRWHEWRNRPTYVYVAPRED